MIDQTVTELLDLAQSTFNSLGWDDVLIAMFILGLVGYMIQLAVSALMNRGD